MNKKYLFFLLIICLQFIALFISGCVGKRVLSPEESLKMDFPKVEAKSVKLSPIEALYEVSSGTNILYYSPKSSTLVVGEIYSKTGENLTAKSRDMLVQAAVKELPLDKAIKIGDGKNTVIMWTDPDCPYCRTLEEYFKDKKDITRYVYLLPLEQLHPKAMAKSENILCQKDEDRKKVFFETLSGAYDKSDVSPCQLESVKALLAEYKLTAQKIGVRGTPVLVVNGTIVRGADTKMIDSLLIDRSRQ